MTFKNKIYAAVTQMGAVSYFDILANLLLSLIWFGAWQTILLAGVLFIWSKTLLPTSVRAALRSKQYYKNLLTKVIVFAAVGYLGVTFTGWCLDAYVTPYILHAALASLAMIQAHCLNRSRNGNFWGIALLAFTIAWSMLQIGLLPIVSCDIVTLTAILTATMALRLEFTRYNFAIRGLLLLSMLTINTGLLSTMAIGVGVWLARGLFYRHQSSVKSHKKQLHDQDVSDCINEILSIGNRWQRPFGHSLPPHKHTLTQSWAISVLKKTEALSGRIASLPARLLNSSEWQVYALFHALETAQNHLTSLKKAAAAPALMKETGAKDDSDYMNMIAKLIGRNGALYEAYFGVVLATYTPQGRYVLMPEHPDLDIALQPDHQVDHIEGVDQVIKEDLIFTSEIIRQLCFEISATEATKKSRTFHSHCRAMMASKGHITQSSYRWGDYLSGGKIKVNKHSSADSQHDIGHYKWTKEQFSVWSLVYRYGLSQLRDPDCQKRHYGRARAESENFITNMRDWLCPSDQVLLLLQLEGTERQNLSAIIINWLVLNDTYEYIRDPQDLEDVAMQILSICPINSKDCVDLEFTQRQIHAIRAYEYSAKDLDPRAQWGVLLYAACSVLVKQYHINGYARTDEQYGMDQSIKQVQKVIEIACQRKNLILQNIVILMLARITRSYVSLIGQSSNFQTPEKKRVSSNIFLENAPNLGAWLRRLDENIQRHREFAEIEELFPYEFDEAVKIIQDSRDHWLGGFDPSRKQRNDALRKAINALITRVDNGTINTPDRDKQAWSLLKSIVEKVKQSRPNYHVASKVGQLGKTIAESPTDETLLVGILQHLMVYLLRLKSKVFLDATKNGGYRANGEWYLRFEQVFYDIAVGSEQVDSDPKIKTLKVAEFLKGEYGNHLLLQQVLLSVISQQKHLNFSSIDMPLFYNLVLQFDYDIIVEYHGALRSKGLMIALINCAIGNILQKDNEGKQQESLRYLLSLIECKEEAGLMLSQELEAILKGLYHREAAAFDPIRIHQEDSSESWDVTSEDLFGAVMLRYIKDAKDDHDGYARLLDMSLENNGDEDSVRGVPPAVTDMKCLQTRVFNWVLAHAEDSANSRDTLFSCVRESMNKWLKRQPSQLGHNVYLKVQEIIGEQKTMSRASIAYQLLDKLAAYGTDDVKIASNEEKEGHGDSIGSCYEVKDTESGGLNQIVTKRQRANSMVPAVDPYAPSSDGRLFQENATVLVSGPCAPNGDGSLFQDDASSQLKLARGTDESEAGKSNQQVRRPSGSSPNGVLTLHMFTQKVRGQRQSESSGSRSPGSGTGT